MPVAAVSTGGGRDCDHRRHSGGDPRDTAIDGGVLRQWMGMGGEQRHRPGEVDRRSSADHES
jgi:hypothetical protein